MWGKRGLKRRVRNHTGYAITYLHIHGKHIIPNTRVLVIFILLDWIIENCMSFMCLLTYDGDYTQDLIILYHHHNYISRRQLIAHVMIIHIHQPYIFILNIYIPTLVMLCPFATKN